MPPPSYSCKFFRLCPLRSALFSPVFGRVSSDWTMAELTHTPWLWPGKTRPPGRPTPTRGYIRWGRPGPGGGWRWSWVMRCTGGEWGGAPGETTSWRWTQWGNMRRDMTRYPAWWVRWGPGARIMVRGGGARGRGTCPGGPGVTTLEPRQECRVRDWASFPVIITSPECSSPLTETITVSSQPPAQPPPRTRTLSRLLSYRTMPSSTSTWPPGARGRRRSRYTKCCPPPSGWANTDRSPGQVTPSVHLNRRAARLGEGWAISSSINLSGYN